MFFAKACTGLLAKAAGACARMLCVLVATTQLAARNSLAVPLIFRGVLHVML